jgi:hypothetical protein
MERSEPSVHPLLDVDRYNTSSKHPGYTDTSNSSEQDDSDTTKTKRDGPSAQSEIDHPRAATDSGWRRGPHSMRRIWNRSWTAETLSFIVSILTLAGLIATLLAHQHRPLPQWPRLVNINSIISLFSLLMRSCVGVVLAEGTSRIITEDYR